MATAISMPKLGLSMKTGTVGKWLKIEGDTIKKGEALIEVMTDKITNKVEAPADGTLLKIVADKGAKLPVGGLMGVIGEAGEDISAILAAGPADAGAAAPKAAVPGERVKISPAARKLADENGIDYSHIAGTGPEGRITREDVEKAIEGGVGPADDRPVLKVIPYEGMRKAIGENMISSWLKNAKVTQHVSVDMSGILTMRQALNDGVKDKDKISVTALLTKAVARAIEVNPIVNITLDGDEVKTLKDINIGMAVAIDDGLIVPVIRNANEKRLAQINAEINDLAKRGRKNKLNPDEMSGATFTITNLGGYGSVDWFTPIINPPESAILGVGRTIDKPVAVKGEVVIRPMMGLSLSFDHRIIDGAPAAEFLAGLIHLIENPNKIFI
ncbi:MAG TPA: dihydrolipoamide acetyltransferase family protein [Syntrophomonadaceae bacterium]|nr:dihydrolipoamide acetyltransferase family protein [Syntrophomonadaceae bacterium]